MGNFIPMIKRDTEADSMRQAERIVKSAFREALGFEDVAKAVAPFKTDGVVLGHRVLDDDAAVKAVKKHAPSHLKSAIDAQKLLPYRETQLLNMVLRAEFEMVKGKLTGNISPRRLAHRAQSETSTQAQ